MGLGDAEDAGLGWGGLEGPAPLVGTMGRFGGRAQVDDVA